MHGLNGIQFRHLIDAIRLTGLDYRGGCAGYDPQYESGPIKWNYLFHLDFEGAPIAEIRASSIMDDLVEFSIQPDFQTYERLNKYRSKYAEISEVIWSYIHQHQKKGNAEMSVIDKVTDALVAAGLMPTAAERGTFERGSKRYTFDAVQVYEATNVKSLRTIGRVEVVHGDEGATHVQPVDEEARKRLSGALAELGPIFSANADGSKSGQYSSRKTLGEVLGPTETVTSMGNFNRLPEQDQKDALEDLEQVNKLLERVFQKCQPETQVRSLTFDVLRDAALLHGRIKREGFK